MDKLEYSDFYKFMASLGVALMFGGGVLPYLYLKESFNLNLKISDYQELTPTAKELLNQKSVWLTGLYRSVPVVSVALFIAGLSLVVWGVVKWHARQKIRDERENVSLEKEKNELRKMTEGDRAAKALAESLEINQFPKGKTIPDLLAEDQEEYRSTRGSTVENVRAYLKLQDEVTEALERQISAKEWEIESNIRLASDEFDVIVRRKGKPDIVAEIKARTTVSMFWTWLSQVVDQHSARTQAYGDRLGRSAIPLILVYAPSGVIRGGQLDQQLDEWRVKHPEAPTVMLIPLDQAGSFNYSPILEAV